MKRLFLVLAAGLLLAGSASARWDARWEDRWYAAAKTENDEWLTKFAAAREAEKQAERAIAEHDNADLAALDAEWEAGWRAKIEAEDAAARARAPIEYERWSNSKNAQEARAIEDEWEADLVAKIEARTKKPKAKQKAQWKAGRKAARAALVAIKDKKTAAIAKIDADYQAWYEASRKRAQRLFKAEAEAAYKACKEAWGTEKSWEEWDERAYNAWRRLPYPYFPASKKPPRKPGLPGIRVAERNGKR